MKPTKQAVLLCGGKGQRLLGRSIQPKCLQGIGHRRMLDYPLDFLRSHGVEEIFLLCGPHYETFSNQIHDDDCVVVGSKKFNGSIGEFHEIKDSLTGPFWVAYGDVYIDAAIKTPTGFNPFVYARKSDHPEDSDMLSEEIGRCFSVSKFGPGVRNLASIGLYWFPHIPDNIPLSGDWMKDFFLVQKPACCVEEIRDPFFISDMGTPERAAHVEAYLEKKRTIIEVSRRGRFPIRNAFIDLDGTLVPSNIGNYTGNLQLITKECEAAMALANMGVHTFIVTNQARIARGQATREQVEEVINGIKSAYYFTDSAYCPYHPETHHLEGVPELRKWSWWRKPNPGMICDLIAKFRLDPRECCVIGDDYSTDGIMASHMGMPWFKSPTELLNKLSQ